ncbi:MAG: SpoIIE family protein phosphatase [Bacteroidota bacterium]
MNFSRVFKIIFSSIIILSNNSIAQDTIKIDEKLYKSGFVASQYYYFDTDSISTIESIKTKKFLFNKYVKKSEGERKIRVIGETEGKKASPQYNEKIGLIPETKFVWDKIVIKNITEHQTDFVLFGNGLTEYYFSSDNHKFYKANHPILKTELNFLPANPQMISVSLSPDETKIIVRKSERTKWWFNETTGKIQDGILRIFLDNKNKNLKEKWQEKVTDSILMGSILILIFYNLLIFISLKRKIYAYYFLYIFFILFPFIDTEISYKIFGSAISEFFGEISIPLGLAFYSLFILEFFSDSLLKWVKLIKLHLKVVFSFIPLYVIFYSIPENFISEYNSIESIVFYFMIGVYIYSVIVYLVIFVNSFIQLYYRNKTSIYILAGNFSILLCLGITIFAAVNDDSDNDGWLQSVVYGIFAEALIFSLGITNKVNILQKEVEAEQKKSIETLEIKVEERTLELKKEKEVVEYQKQEILDSIEYAKRIQATILPSPKVVKQYLDDSFILYLPKDIVAGDFYWMESVQNDKSPIILFAACDCTGHGVPGALVSVVCHNALNRSVKEYGATEPAAILDKVAELVLDNFSNDDDVKDGMDASLCALNTETGELKWAGANNPLWIVRNNELLEFQANKQPIGKFDDRMPYTNHNIKLIKGDTLYLFTDGYSDQFGGEKNRKLTKAKFKNLLISIASKDMKEQREELLNFHINYKGKEEQTDDILVIGVRV